jgi:hypothetical protein
MYAPHSHVPSELHLDLSGMEKEKRRVASAFDGQTRGKRKSEDVQHAAHQYKLFLFVSQ